MHEGFKFIGWEPVDLISEPITEEETNFYAMYEELRKPEVKLFIFDRVAMDTYLDTYGKPSEDLLWKDYSSHVRIGDDNRLYFNIDEYELAYYTKKETKPIGYMWDTTGDWYHLTSIEDSYKGGGMTPKIKEEISDHFSNNTQEIYEYYIRPTCSLTIFAYGDGSNSSVTVPAGTVFEIEDPQRPGYTFTNWMMQSKYGDKIVDDNFTIYANYTKNQENKFTIRFYRMMGGPDDYDTVDLIGTEEVDKGANIYDLIYQYGQSVRESKGGEDTITKINKGSYTNVTMDMDIYFY